MYNFETRDVKGEFQRIKGLAAQKVVTATSTGSDALTAASIVQGSPARRKECSRIHKPMAPMRR